MMTSTHPYLTSPTSTQRSASDHKKLRSACDACHQCKVKCSGGSPCFRCTTKGLLCRYGYQNRAGKPKGSKNRKTLEREHQLRMEWLTSQLREADEGLGDMNIDLSAPTLLPSPSFQPSRWKQVRETSGSTAQPVTTSNGNRAMFISNLLSTPRRPINVSSPPNMRTNALHRPMPWIRGRWT